MEKNILKIDDLVYIKKDDCYDFTSDKSLIDKERKINKKIKVMNHVAGPITTTGISLYDAKLYKVLHITEDKKWVFVENASGKYTIYNSEVVHKFPNIGDRVVYNKKEYGIVREYSGSVRGTGVGDKLGLLETIIGVEFEEAKTGRHNLGGSCPDDCGWYCELNKLQVINEEQKQEQKQDQMILANSKELEKLSQEIEKLVEENKKLNKTIARKDRFQDLLNEAVIDKAKDIAVEDYEERLKQNLDDFIQRKYGVLPKRIEVVTDTTKKELTGIFHKEFENICRIVKSDIPLMLVGSAGAGKNHTLEQVAEALELDFYFSNAVNQEYKLTGFIDANGKYHETQFYQAFTKGGMFFLDEIDASCPECLVILNSAIANRYFDFPTGRVKAHENFRVVCAGNTYGTGADMVYVGRNVLDGATLDRFVVLPFDYDEQVEKQLAYDDNLYYFIRALRKAIEKANLRYIVSMRALINATKLLKIGVDKDSILKTTIIKNMQIDDLNTIVSEVSKTYNSDWTDCLRRMCDNVRN